MRLTQWKLHPVHLPYHRVIKWRDHVESGSDFLLLAIESDEGDRGVAEVTVKPTWNGESLRSLIAAIEDFFMPSLKNADIGDPASLTAAFSVFPENQTARTLIDNACWDLRATAAGKPLWQTWGGQGRVALSWAVTRQPPLDMAREAADMVGRHGFRTLKIKGGQGFATDLQALREIRRAVGDDVRFYVDPNWSYRSDETISYASMLAAEGVVALEDPYLLQPDDMLAQLQQQCSIPLLVDNACVSLRDARLYLERGARALSVKPGRLGLTDCRAMEALAAQRGCATAVGLFGESGLGSLSALQMAAYQQRNPANFPAEVSFFLMFADQVLLEPLTIAGGQLDLPTTPGLASLVDWKKVERLRASRHA